MNTIKDIQTFFEDEIALTEKENKIKALKEEI